MYLATLNKYALVKFQEVCLPIVFYPLATLYTSLRCFTQYVS